MEAKDKKGDDKSTSSDVKYCSMKSEFMDFDDKEVVVELKFKKPTKGQLNRAQKAAQKSPAQAFQQLLVDTIHPDEKEKLLVSLEEYPGLVTSFADKIFEKAGFGSLGK